MNTTLFHRTLAVHMANTVHRTRFDASSVWAIGAMVWMVVIALGVLLVAWRM